MRHGRLEEKLRLLAARRDALAELSDELEALHSELTFFECDTAVLLEHPAVAPAPELCTGIETLGIRVGACDERVFELQQKVAAAIVAADAALTQAPCPPQALN